MPELAAIICREIDRPVDYRIVERTRKDLEAEFLKRFGTPEQWLDDRLTAGALNKGVVRFHGKRGPLPTTMETFVRNVWRPRYLKAVAEGDAAETFPMWSAGH